MLSKFPFYFDKNLFRHIAAVEVIMTLGIFTEKVVHARWMKEIRRYARMGHGRSKRCGMPTRLGGFHIKYCVAFNPWDHYW